VEPAALGATRNLRGILLPPPTQTRDNIWSSLPPPVLRPIARLGGSAVLVAKWSILSTR
jgi:hypothetical protein